MNGHCSTCDVEDRCGYLYKPCDCRDYRKYQPKPAEVGRMRAEMDELFMKGKINGSSVPHT